MLGIGLTVVCTARTVLVLTLLVVPRYCAPNKSLGVNSLKRYLRMVNHKAHNSLTTLTWSQKEIIILKCSRNCRVASFLIDNRVPGVFQFLRVHRSYDKVNLATKTMHTNEQVIDLMVDNLFRAAVIDKDEFHRKAKQNMRKTFDAYVHPFAIAEEDRMHKVSMRSIMSAPLDPSAAWKPILLDQILPVLHLEVPKKVVQYMPSMTPIVDPSKPKQVKVRGQRGQPRQFKTIKRSQPEVASIYAEADEVDLSNSDQPASKRSRLSKGGDGIEEDDRRYGNSVSLDAEDEYEPVARRSTPANFYTVVGPLFNEFWAMEFDNFEVTAAFFALITHANCRDYKLEAFAEQSYSLTVIKEKLKNQAYCSIEDFVYDFNQLFNNIFTYYAETHEAYRKAVELSLLFKERWAELVPKFK